MGQKLNHVNLRIALMVVILFTAMAAFQSTPVLAEASTLQGNGAVCLSLGGCTSVSTMFPGSVASGHVIVVVVGSYQNSVDVAPQVSDTRGTTFTRIMHDYISTPGMGTLLFYLVIGIYVGVITSTGDDAVTSSISSSATPVANYVYAFEVSGVSSAITLGTAGQLWIGAIGADGGTSISTSSALQFPAGSFLLGAIGTTELGCGVSVTAGQGFSSLKVADTQGCTAIQAQFATTFAPPSPTNFPATLSKARDWVEVAVILFPASNTSSTFTASQPSYTDWSVASVGIQPASPTPGTAVKFQMLMVALSTSGGYPQRVVVYCFLDGASCGSGRITYPGPTSTPFTVNAATLWNALPGAHILSWQIDVANDPNPTNNVMSLTFNVQAATTTQSLTQPITIESPTSQVTIIQTQTVTQPPTSTVSQASPHPGILDMLQQNSLLLIAALAALAVILAVAMMRRGSRVPKPT